MKTDRTAKDYESELQAMAAEVARARASERVALAQIEALEHSRKYWEDECKKSNIHSCQLSDHIKSYRQEENIGIRAFNKLVRNEGGFRNGTLVASMLEAKALVESLERVLKSIHELEEEQSDDPNLPSP